MSIISNWGKYPAVEGQVKQFRKNEVPQYAKWIPRGMGRCYGDASLGESMISCLSLNRFLEFDETTGLLTCESGVTFDDILCHFLPKGWFPPVTPGTKFVSLGGAIAADVHGKNHHKEGSIADFVDKLKILLPNGEVMTCSRSTHPKLFWHTIGGMGLTGLILTVSLYLKPVKSSYIQTESIKARNLSEILELFDEFESTTYSVAWIDCMARGNKMGRSILIKGEHATTDQLSEKQNLSPLAVLHRQKLNIPINFPSFALNPTTVQIFNFFYYHKQFNERIKSVESYDAFFYPLDSIHNWNKIYGKKGFTQYQFVIPKSDGKKGMQDILSRISGAGLGSFLAVLKLMGKENEMSPMSFPLPGYTLALDFPISPKLFPFLNELDRVVVNYGGRVYLAKDARMKAAMLDHMYPHIDLFKTFIKELGNTGQIQSLQSARLCIHQ